MENKPQESVNGLYVGDRVGVITRNAGYIGKIEEILDWDWINNRSLIRIRILATNATIVKLDKDVTRLPNVIERD